MTSPTTGQIWPRARTTVVEGGGGGTAILSGTANPTGAVGAVGDYYLDTDDNILYGPKAATPPDGPDEYVTPSTVSSLGGPAMLGMKHRFAVPGLVKGIRVFTPSAGSPSNVLEVHLFTGAGTLLASKDVADGTLTRNAWTTILFDAPVGVIAATTYIAAVWTVGVFTVGGDAVSPGGAYPGATSGNVTMLADGVDGLQATYHGTRDTCPTIDYGVASIAIAAVFTTGPASPWPVALKSVPRGGATGQVLKKTSNTDYAVGWVT
jgi:hypothetical protein